MGNLPPKWYSKLSRWALCNKAWIWIALFLLFFVVIPLFKKAPSLDSVLVDGIAGGE